MPSPSCSVAKHSFPGVAREDHPARDADDVVGRRVDRQVRVGGANLGQGVGPLDGDRVRVAALRQQASALFPTDLELLGKVRIGFRALRAHDVPA